jgi:hypothetical protein
MMAGVSTIKILQRRIGGDAMRYSVALARLPVKDGGCGRALYPTVFTIKLGYTHDIIGAVMQPSCCGYS